ncbi:MAG TPA: thioesterase family protein [Bryobacteraceae bacterium]|nr:thioesterase family protein [Bryobacteraceae bacterium]
MPNFKHRVRVAFVDTDASGRIHFTAMLRYFEAAELEFLRWLGFSYRDAPHTGYPRVRVECEYRSAIVFDDELDIAVSVKRIGSSSYTLEFAALKDGAVAASGTIVAVCVDRVKQKAQAMPERLREALRREASPAV